MQDTKLASKKSQLQVDRRLKSLVQCAVAAEKANEIMGTIMKVLIMRQDISFFLSLKGAMHPHCEDCVLFWLLHLKIDILKLGKAQLKANIMIRVMGQLHSEGKLKDWDNSGI